MQVFDPDGGGVAPDMLVVGGAFDVGASRAVSVAAYDGSEWQPLGTPPSGTCTALSVPLPAID